jgi:FKBP-type peptidyl-prolyl cis-trans isomerase
MKFCITFLLILIAFFSYSQKKVRYKHTESGLGYKIVKKGKGKKIEKLDRLYVHYNLFFKSDTGGLKTVMLNGTKDFIIGQDEVLKGWDEGFLLLKEGDSCLFKIPPHLGYGDKKVGKITPQSTLFLQAKVTKAEEAFYPHNGLDTAKFKSGLKKILVKAGDGKQAKPYEEVRMRFTGYVYSTKGYRQVFESSKTNSQEAVFQLGSGRMLAGVDEGIATMRVGEKATFIIPSNLGFGDKPAGKILPNTTLYFDVELVSSINTILKPLNTDTVFFADSVKLLLSEKAEGNLITEEDVVTFHYKSYYKNTNGEYVVYDNSFERNQPLTIRPGSGSAFPGVEQAFLKLKNGEKATVIVPNNVANSRRKVPVLTNKRAAFYDLYILSTFSFPFMNLLSKDTITYNSGLRSIYNSTGFGNEVKKGNTVKIAYTIYVVDEKGVRHILDGSRDSGKYLDIEVGAGKNIKGVEEGLIGMKTGSTKRLIIPPALGYGENGLPEKGIPAKTNLIFDIESLEIIK